MVASVGGELICVIARSVDPQLTGMIYGKTLYLENSATGHMVSLIGNDVYKAMRKSVCM